MLARGVVATMRSPIRRVKHYTFRGTPVLRRSLLLFSFLSSSFSLLEGLLTCGEPHEIVAAFLHSANNEDKGCGALQRVLSCGVSRSVLLCACVAMVTPSRLWPPFVAQRLKSPREGRNTYLTSPSWRAFAFALVRCIHVTGSNDCGSSPFSLLCATCLAPSVEVGEHLAVLSCASAGESSTCTAAAAKSLAADAATAFATCCLMRNEDTKRSDVVWMQLWATLRSAPDDTLNPAWVRCHDLYLGCLLRAGRHGDIEEALCETVGAPMLYHMSETTLAKLFLVESLSLVMQREILAALLHVSRVKSEEVRLFPTLSPFERSRILPSVTKNSTLFAKALRCLVLQAREEPSVENYTRVFRDIQGLCRVSNSYALAASLIPQDCSLSLLMIASLNEERTRLLATFVEAVGEVTELTCNFARRGDASSHSECVEATLQECVSVLTGLLALCSSRREKLPQRRAEPEWRRRLRRETAVRSHKYELLCGELPHALLTRCLSTLLVNGFVCTGGDLGGCLAVADFVDLHHYTLGLLGSLYHAARLAHRQPDELAVICALYHRRREVFGEDVFSLVQRASATEQSITTLLLCDTAMVKYEGTGAGYGASLGPLRSRSIVAAGGSIVIDSSFGIWLRKVSSSVSGC